MLNRLHHFTIGTILAAVAAAGAVAPLAASSIDLRSLLDRPAPRTGEDRRTEGASTSDEGAAHGATPGPSFADLRRAFPDCGPAVDRFEAAVLRVADALSVAESYDECDATLWALSEEFEVACAAISFAVGVSAFREATALLVDGEALKAKIPAVLLGSVVGDLLTRFIDAALKIRGAITLPPETLASAFEAELSDEVRRAAHFANAVEATRSVFAPRYLRNMLSGQHRVFVGLMALDAMPAQAPAVLAFLEEALRDYESSADTVTNETLRQQDELAVAALQGRMERLAEEAEQRADEAVDDLVTIPFLRPEDDARWQADAQRGLDAQRRGPPTDET